MSMRYVATINVPGYLPMADDLPEFDTAAQAWQYLADERRHEEDDTDDGDPYSDTHATLVRQAEEDGGAGTIYGDTPGYEGDHDLGLAYTVTQVEHVHSPVAGMMVVHEEDLDTVAAVRTVECESCDRVYLRRSGRWVLP